MSTKWKAVVSAVEGLYRAFESYPLRSELAYEPSKLCLKGDFIPPEERARIHSKPLRLLASEDLLDYAKQAGGPWGDWDDYRHFLPRILEILTGDFHDEFVLPEEASSKLADAQWWLWPSGEKDAIKKYYHTTLEFVLGGYSVAQTTRFPEHGVKACDWLYNIAWAERDLAPYLNRWEGDPSLPATLHFADLITSDIDPGEDGRSAVHIGRDWPESLQQIVDWAVRPEQLARLDGVEHDSLPKDWVDLLVRARKELESLIKAVS